MEISFYFFFRERKLIFKNYVNRNLKKITVSRKKAKILTVNRKIHNPIETLRHRNGGLLSLISSVCYNIKYKYFVTAMETKC